ncbi:hypothetical protein ACKLNR_004695 [Fusarium oxysporum f. sp. zingiberi]
MASLSDRKLRNVKKRAFVFKYTLGEGETVFDVPQIVKRFVGENTRYGTFYAIDTNPDGSRTVQTVLSVPSRLRISSFAESKRWRNAGASVNRVSDLTYPEGNSSVRSFLEKWARDVARRPVTRQMGSKKNLFSALDKYQDWEANHKFRDGRIPKKAKTPRKRYSVNPEVDEQTSTDELSHSDTGDEFTNPIKEGPRNGMTTDEWACEALLDIGDMPQEPVQEQEEVPGCDFLAFLDALEVPHDEVDYSQMICCDEQIFSVTGSDQVLWWQPEVDEISF